MSDGKLQLPKPDLYVKMERAPDREHYYKLDTVVELINTAMAAELERCITAAHRAVHSMPEHQRAFSSDLLIFHLNAAMNGHLKAAMPRLDKSDEDIKAAVVLERERLVEGLHRAVHAMPDNQPTINKNLLIYHLKALMDNHVKSVVPGASNPWEKAIRSLISTCPDVVWVWADESGNVDWLASLQATFHAMQDRLIDRRKTTFPEIDPNMVNPGRRASDKPTEGETMTTKVTVDAHAGWPVKVTRIQLAGEGLPPGTIHHETTVQPGSMQEFHVHSHQELHIKEMPIEPNAAQQTPEVLR